MRRIIYKAIIVCVRPYVSRELFGWGRVYNFFVGGWRRDWFWKGAPTYIIKDKMHATTLISICRVTTTERTSSCVAGSALSINF